MNKTWRAAVLSSLLGGVAFLVLQMTLVPLLTSSGPLAPLRWTASLVLGARALAGPFDATTLAVGLAVHAVLSIVYGVLLVGVVHRWFAEKSGPGVIAGAMYGFLLYIVNFGLLVAVFPQFSGAPAGAGVLSHIAFGVLTVAIYQALLRTRDARGGVTPPSSWLWRRPRAAR